MTALTLDKVLVDWVTLTGKAHQDIIDVFGDFSLTRNDWTHTAPQKWLQWQGELRSYGDGSVFTGMAEINKEDWMVVRASGELSQEVLTQFFELTERGVMRVTRIDTQVTVIEPDGWGQINLCNRLYASGKNAQFLGSIDGYSGRKLETVGVGSRTSETFTRIYEKITDGGVKLLRLETEYKGEKARALVTDLEFKTITQQMKWHVQSLRDDKLEAVYANALHGISPHNSKAKAHVSSKKKKWLLNTVLPSFEEYINNHSEDGVVLQAFLAVIDEVLQ